MIQIKNFYGITPLFIFDGDCHFCRYWVAKWKDLTGDKVNYAPYQEVGRDYPEIPVKDFQTSSRFISISGEVTGGAEAAFRALTYSKAHRWIFWAYKTIPGVKFVSELVYRVVAGNRPIFSWLTRLIWGKEYHRPSHFIPRWLFFRILGAVYLIAFVSLWVQVLGLVGSNGILPVEPYLSAVQQQVGTDGYRLVPTVFWFNSSDLALQVVCGTGAFFSLLLIYGLAPVPVLLVLWALYLSLLSVCREFLGFQWDVLLLETGFLALFLAPLQFEPDISREAPPSKIILFLFSWLGFKLMFLAGMVKRISGDPTWRDLTALNFHYYTQPIPTWTSWYAHHLPESFQKFSVFMVFVIELALPFFIFAPRRLRYAAVLSMMGFMVLIMATGNYCFFNILTVAILLLLLDDSFWPKKIQKWFRDRREWARDFPSWGWPRVVIVPVAVLLFLGSTYQMTARLRVRVGWPDSFVKAVRFIAPFHSINHYGLFAVMTTTRPEIIVEGSNDQRIWLPYEFKYKPGDLYRRPAFVEPHQPRLDWQMWFAALGNYRQNQWFLSFCQRLMEGSPEVLGLLAKNPFPDDPPRYIRAVTYEYQFSDSKLKRETGQWWKREKKGLYIPAVSLRGR